MGQDKYPSSLAAKSQIHSLSGLEHSNGRRLVVDRILADRYPSLARLTEHRLAPPYLLSPALKLRFPAGGYGTDAPHC